MQRSLPPDPSFDPPQELIAAFPEQPLDFFAAIKARLADRAVLQWLSEVGYQVM